MADGDSRTRGRLDVSVVQGRTVTARGLKAWLERVAPVRARGAVTVALVSDAQVRKLNLQYRKKDSATDVLSFPTEGRPEGRPLRMPRRRMPRRMTHVGADLQVGPSLGDIVIATGVATRQARAAGHSVQTELRVLALHGLLHLLGYDHERDNGQMARVELRLRRTGRLTEGLIERGHS